MAICQTTIYIDPHRVQGCSNSPQEGDRYCEGCRSRLNSHRPLTTLEDISRICSGFGKISLDEFGKILKDTIGADEGYIQGCWPRFKSDYLGYCLSRNPLKQGEALFALAQKKSSLPR